MAKSLYFSIFSGEIYEVDSEDESTLDAFQVPLKTRPNSNCKKCHGRYYTCYNLTFKHYEICPKCTKKCADLKKILDRKNKPKTKNGK